MAIENPSFPGAEPTANELLAPEAMIHARRLDHALRRLNQVEATLVATQGVSIKTPVNTPMAGDGSRIFPLAVTPDLAEGLKRVIFAEMEDLRVDNYGHVAKLVVEQRREREERNPSKPLPSMPNPMFRDIDVLHLLRMSRAQIQLLKIDVILEATHGKGKQIKILDEETQKYIEIQITPALQKGLANIMLDEGQALIDAGHRDIAESILPVAKKEGDEPTPTE